MAGGLLNLVAYGNQNLMLNGNPSKTFFKTAYSKYTNFGLQKFRIDYEGLKKLQLTDESVFQFKIPRYAELLMDTYLVINIPNIWSPAISPDSQSSNTTSDQWIPYDFKWIDNLGTQFIKEVSILCGGQILQKFSGNYLQTLVNRDFSDVKKDLYNKMTGNTSNLNDPANYGRRVNQYPTACYVESSAGVEPSIRGQTLYIPINCWFTLNSQMAYPLISQQYNELYINVTLRPVNELFRIRDVNYVMDNNVVLDRTDTTQVPYIKPNFNIQEQQFYYFLQTPPPDNNYTNKNTDPRDGWNIHLLSTYAFLSDEESRVFATNEQKYLFKEIHEWSFKNVTGTRKVELDSLGMVANWTFFFQRSDINLRNEWSNYTNWPYNYLPNDVVEASMLDSDGHECNNLYVTGEYKVENHKDILINMGILLNGEYRENTLDSGVYNYVEKYIKTAGNAPDGVYCYNFGLNTNPFVLRPSGAINMSLFKLIELEFTTYSPPLDPSAQFLTICDPSTGIPIGVNKPTWRIYDYNYDLTILEERYNMIIFMGGNCGLSYAR
jgi:hypothetical protein